MKIMMSDIMRAKNPDTLKHTKAQGVWAMTHTGEDNPERAISALYKTNINAVVWQEFYLARNITKNPVAGHFRPSEARLDEICANIKAAYLDKGAKA